jgi:molybdenum cofactor guanylyltransferase
MTLSAVLLAGGKSRRMGQDKATMLFRGTPLWQIQLELLRKLQPAELFISAQTDPPWQPAGVEFVADDRPGCGPLGGIAAVLSRIMSDHLLALAIDMPFMSEGYLLDLWRRVEPGRGVVPLIGDRAEPLAAIYPREARSEFVHALSGSDFSLQRLVGQLIAAGKLYADRVSEVQRSLFVNLNQPPDLAPD